MTQSADEYATDIVAAFETTLRQRMNEAETAALEEHIEADLKPDAVRYIALEMLARPDWVPESKG